MKLWRCTGHDVTVELWPAVVPHLGTVYTVSTQASLGAGAQQWLTPSCTLLDMATPRAVAAGERVPLPGGGLARARCTIVEEQRPDPVAAGHGLRRHPRGHRVRSGQQGGGRR